MPKRLYFLLAVVVPVAKVFFSPSQSYSFLKILILEATRQVRTFAWGPWEQTRTFGNASMLRPSAGALLSPSLCRRIALSLGWRQTRRDTWMFAFCFSSSGERTVTLAGMLLPESLEDTLDSIVWKMPACREVGNWTGRFDFPFVQRNRAFKRCFKGRQLHPVFPQRNNPNLQTFNQTTISKVVQKQRVRQWLQTTVKILTVHKVCQSTDQF